MNFYHSLSDFKLTITQSTKISVNDDDDNNNEDDDNVDDDDGNDNDNDHDDNDNNNNENDNNGDENDDNDNYDNVNDNVNDDIIIIINNDDVVVENNSNSENRHQRLPQFPPLFICSGIYIDGTHRKDGESGYECVCLIKKTYNGVMKSKSAETKILVSYEVNK